MGARQFYKITLDPAQTIYLTGEVTGSPTHGTQLKIDLYDSNQVFIVTLVTKGAYGTATFPTGGTFPTFTPPGGGPSDYYLKASATVWPAHDFQFEVVLQPCAVPINYVIDASHPPVAINTGDPPLNYPMLLVQYVWSSSTGDLADLSQCLFREKLVRPTNYATFPSPPFKEGDTQTIPTYNQFPASIVPRGYLIDQHVTGQPFAPPYSAISIVTAQTYQYRCPCANSNNWVNMYEVFGGIDRAFSQNADGTWRHSITKHGYTASKTIPQ